MTAGQRQLTRSPIFDSLSAIEYSHIGLMNSGNKLAGAVQGERRMARRWLISIAAVSTTHQQTINPLQR